MKLTAYQNDTLDLLLYRQFGQTNGLVELALDDDKSLANTPILTMGQQVEIEQTESVTDIENSTVQLWD